MVQAGTFKEQGWKKSTTLQNPEEASFLGGFVGQVSTESLLLMMPVLEKDQKVKRKFWRLVCRRLLAPIGRLVQS